MSTDLVVTTWPIHVVEYHFPRTDAPYEGPSFEMVASPGDAARIAAEYSAKNKGTGCGAIPSTAPRWWLEEMDASYRCCRCGRQFTRPENGAVLNRTEIVCVGCCFREVPTTVEPLAQSGIIEYTEVYR